MGSFGRRTPRTFFFVLLALSAAGLAGCGKPTAKVTGTVTYKDKPVRGGFVLFARPDGHTDWADIKEDGSYSFDKIATGAVTVGVDTSTLKPPSQGSRLPGGDQGHARGYAAPGGQANPNQGSDPAERAKRYVALPAKYTQPANSGLTYTVTAGKQEHDIKLD